MNRFLDIRSYLYSLSFTFRALKSRNFRLFFFAGLVSLMGTWIQNIAIGWMVYRITDSAFYLGMVGFAGLIPALFLTPIAGVYADRLNRRRMLIITQTIPMLLAFLLAALAYTESIHIGVLLVIVTINGFALAFDTPFRHAFLHDMIGDKSLLPNAVALNSTLVNTARFLGPTIGGFLIAFFGEAFCYLLNGISFIGVIIALLAMQIAPHVQKPAKGRIWSDLREGFSYTFNFLPARYMILLVMLTSLLGLPFQGFLPVFARDILNGDSQLLGFLTGAVGAGALTGAFFLATRESVRRLPSVIRFSALLFSVGLTIFSFSTNTAFSLIVLYFSGFGMIAQFVATNAILQTVVSDDKKGRVLSFYSMSFMGFTPLGSLFLGIISGWIGVPYTFTLAGLVLLGAALLFGAKVERIKQMLLAQASDKEG